MKKIDEDLEFEREYEAVYGKSKQKRESLIEMTETEKIDEQVVEMKRKIIAKNNKPFYKKWWFWAILVLLLFAAPWRNRDTDDTRGEEPEMADETDVEGEEDNETTVEEISYMMTWSLLDESYINEEMTTYSEFDERYIYQFEFGPVFLDSGTYLLVLNSTGIEGGMTVSLPFSVRSDVGFVSERSTLNNYGEIIGFASFGASNSTVLENEATLIVSEGSYIEFIVDDLENYNAQFFESMSLYRVN